MYQFSYRPPEEKMSQKKSQQSQEVCALVKYTCYPLLCLLDLWSTFEGLIKLKQISLIIYSSIWEIQSCEEFGKFNFTNWIWEIGAIYSVILRPVIIPPQVLAWLRENGRWILYPVTWVCTWCLKDGGSLRLLWLKKLPREWMLEVKTFSTMFPERDVGNVTPVIQFVAMSC